MSGIGRALSVLFVCVACLQAHARQGRRPTLQPSNVLEKVKQYKARRPGVGAAALARYANALVARRGFDYDFNACEIFPSELLADGGAGPATGALHTFRHRLTRLDGRAVTFDLVANDYGGMCSECFLTLPALRVTGDEMQLVAGDGAVYVLKRPESFALDEAQLVGSNLKTVVRTWRLPYQTIPEGISPDGRQLYVGFHDEDHLEELVLEISVDGHTRFRVKQEVGIKGGELIEDHPKDPNNAYLSFERFRAGGRTYVVRFSGPCT